MAILTKVEVAGVDLTAYLLKYQIDQSAGESIAEADIDFTIKASDAVTFATGQEVKIYRGTATATDKRVFWGNIEKYEPEGGRVKLICKDKLWNLVRKEVTKVYDSSVDASAGKISDIFLDLVNTYGELNASAASVQDSGAVILIEKFLCNHTDVFERCKTLAKILDWQFYYRPDTDLVYFEAVGYTASGLTWTVGTEIIQIPKWNYDMTELINDLTVTGAVQEVETTESGRIGTTTGYATTSVLLTYIPESVKVYADAANPPTTLKAGGVPDVIGTYYYYVDKENKKIMPKATTTFTTNDYFEVRYSFMIPTPINVYNQTSIDTYGSFVKTIPLKDIRSVADAETRADKLLSIYKDPFTYATLRVRCANGYAAAVGDTLTIVDAKSKPAVNAAFSINRIVRNYPGSYDEVYVGDREWRLSEWQASVEERLRRLSEVESNQEIVTDLITMDNSVADQIIIKPQYQMIITETYNAANLVLILDNTARGILGTNKLGTAATAFSADVTVFVKQYLNVYTETFGDDDFKSASTNATWSNANKWLSYTSGQIGQSTSVDYANGTITDAKITVVIDSGTFTLQLSANGGTNWENATSGVLLHFTNTGTDLRWKITEAGASTGKITSIVISNYHDA
jgi:hypothetical protein